MRARYGASLSCEPSSVSRLHRRHTFFSLLSASIHLFASLPLCSCVSHMSSPAVLMSVQVKLAQNSSLLSPRLFFCLSRSLSFFVCASPHHSLHLSFHLCICLRSYQDGSEFLTLIVASIFLSACLDSSVPLLALRICLIFCLILSAVVCGTFRFLFRSS